MIVDKSLLPLSQADCTEPGTVFARDDCFQCRPSCWHLEDTPNCPRDVCAMSCVCPEGYARRPSDFDQSCIPLSECPKCPLNEVYDAAYSGNRDRNIEPSCENPNPQWEDGRPLLSVGILRHAPLCTCAEGYVRNKSENPIDNCILLSECPDSGQ